MLRKLVAGMVALEAAPVPADAEAELGLDVLFVL